MIHTIGLGQLVVSNHPGDILKTYALGSCIGITVYCRQPLAFGMAHIVLPDSSLMETEHQSVHDPAFFADKAVEALLLEICEKYGCKPKDLEIRLFGGARTVWENNKLNIGQRNYEAVKKVLVDFNLPFDDSEVSGSCSRTIALKGSTGVVKVVKYKLDGLLTG